MDLKEGLKHLEDQLNELEQSARGLENQNFADIIKSAGNKIRQAQEHPDVDKVGELLQPPAPPVSHEGMQPAETQPALMPFPGAEGSGEQKGD